MGARLDVSVGSFNSESFPIGFGWSLTPCSIFKVLQLWVTCSDLSWKISSLTKGSTQLGHSSALQPLLGLTDVVRARQINLNSFVSQQGIKGKH